MSAVNGPSSGYNFDRLVRDLAVANADVKRGVDRALMKTAQDIKATAQGFAPVDTGLLKSSITVEAVHRSSTTVQDASITDHLGSGPGERVETSTVIEIGPTAHYGAYVELGTSRQSPKPYLTPAYDRHVPDLNAAIDSLLRAAGF